MAKDDLPYLELGERLRMIREHAGKTQKMMSSRLSLGATTWQRLEAGTNAPSGETLLAIASLGYDPTWVLTGMGEMRLSIPGSETATPPARPQDEPVAPAPAVTIDGELLGLITEAVARLYKEEGAAPSPRDLGAVAGRLYGGVAAVGPDPRERSGALKFAIEQERQSLRAKAMTR